MTVLVSTRRDQRDVDELLADAMGMREGRRAAGDADGAQTAAGVVDALWWATSRGSQAPITLQHRPSDRTALEDEFRRASLASLDVRSPAHRYAQGAYEALRWLLDDTAARPSL